MPNRLDKPTRLLAFELRGPTAGLLANAAVHASAFYFFVKPDSLRFVRIVVGLAGYVPVRLAPGEWPQQRAFCR